MEGRWVSRADGLLGQHRGIFYAISGNSRRCWDIGPTQELLGYEPEDDAEHYAGAIAKVG
jgi:hypothetical protein